MHCDKVHCKNKRGVPSSLVLIQSHFSMYKIIGGVCALVLVSVSPVSALSVQDIQAQIKELLAKVELLQAQIRQMTTSTIQPVTPVDSVRPLCKRVWNRSLSFGQKGEDIRELQSFLKEEGLLSTEATGFFGSATREAIRAWQTDNGITGTGTVGPLTRAFIEEWCRGGSARFSVSPVTGNAPLTVTFTTDVKVANATMVADAGDYKIVFGDGAEQVLTCSGSNSWCEGPHVVQHTYPSNGVFSAQLVNFGFLAPSSSAQGVIVARRYITVGTSPVGCTKEYAPVCGSRPVVCVMAPCNPVEQTYANKCLLNEAGASYLHAGECTVSGNKAPVVYEFSAPTTLEVGESGVWKISASDPENQQLTYRIDWGDSYTPSTVAFSGLRAPDLFVQDTTFTHAYTRSGTYTVTLYVKDAANNTITTSATVRVGESPVACTMQYQPVCGQPPEPACRYSVPACMMATQGPKTYGNSCQLNAERATFLYEGECQTEYPVACTMDARQCPDGSWAGRTGPRCEFMCNGVVVN